MFVACQMFEVLRKGPSCAPNGFFGILSKKRVAQTLTLRIQQRLQNIQSEQDYNYQKVRTSNL